MSRTYEQRRAQAVSVIRQVLSGAVTREDIPRMETDAECVYAAVGWILLRKDEYLDSRGFVLSLYNNTLEGLTRKPRMSTPHSLHSKNTGLHVLMSHTEPGVPEVTYEQSGKSWTDIPYTQVKRVSKVARLTPPPELGLPPFEPFGLNDEQQATVKQVVDSVIALDNDVATEVARRLQLEFLQGSR